ncbi:GNAT superfamily N-acetyltransferase [Catenuloplanes nepalensis]|uniref:GNAT superfamily N-acetyltransferase n=1 Tax=Catenuloplanes nepalensis TaxID=587533 RepID=A0ABT9MVF8_9ACTN|nr:GNAT family N-acetyltransferase [Catenuloplanes nepalensis]MDP9795432.1 GNAT superfamily N-acetyltransferase [Catenuloplanes nepalensis]
MAVISRPAVTCRPNDLHVLETERLWIVTSRATDYVRWLRIAVDDPESAPDWPEHVVAQARQVAIGSVADPVDASQPGLPVDPDWLFLAGVHRETRELVSSLSVFSRNRASEIGGSVRYGYRGQGYGHETLVAACALAHRHFGIARLVAGAEPSNTASRRWLAGAGFTSATGPPRVKLGNGRTIEALWWEHVDRDAELRCSRPRPHFRRGLLRTLARR